jgi:hypothetical protein
MREFTSKDFGGADKVPNRICIYGDSGVGKTMAISTLPAGRVLMLDFERKASRLVMVDKKHDYTVVQFDDWSDYRKADVLPKLRKLMETHDFIVIDSLTYLRDFAIREKGMSVIFGGAEVMDFAKSQPFYNFLKEQLVKFINDINNLTDKPIIYISGITKNKLNIYAMDVGDTGSVEIPRQLDFVCPLIVGENRERLLVTSSPLYSSRLAAEEELMIAFPNRYITVNSDLKSIQDMDAKPSGLASLLKVLQHKENE